MRGMKSIRHTTEAEDEEMESEQKFHGLFNSLKPKHRRAQIVAVLGKIVGRQVAEAVRHTEELEEEVATRKNKVMQKHERDSKKSSSFRKAA